MRFKPIYAVLGVIAVILMMLFGSYNSLVNLQADVESAQSNIQTTVQRRYDLIPNVVNATKGIMKHESEVFTKIADARAKIGSSSSSAQEVQEAESELSSAVSRLLVLTENYPELKANESVNNLIVELEGTENRILVARKDYNTIATRYNKRLRSLPTRFYAGSIGFEPVSLFEATPGAENAPTIDFGTD